MLKTLLATYKLKGFFNTVKEVFSILYWKYRNYMDYERFDKKYGVETLKIEKDYLDGLPATDIESCEFYQATIWRRFSKSIECLPSESAGFTFIDLGSGKGRALMYAALKGFNKIIGVELSNHLNQIARSNLEQFKKRQNKNYKIELISVDANQYLLPDENLVIFMYNPFTGKTMQKVVENIQQWVTNYNKVFYIIYMNPACPKYLEQAKGIVSLHANDGFTIFSGKAK